MIRFLSFWKKKTAMLSRQKKDTQIFNKSKTLLSSLQRFEIDRHDASTANVNKIAIANGGD